MNAFYAGAAPDARSERHDQNKLEFYFCVPSERPSNQIAADFSFNVVQG